MPFSKLVDAFRGGDAAAGNELLGRYRPWLKLLARLQGEGSLPGKFDGSDIVQQTMLEAFRAASQFLGHSEAEFATWLRQILAHALQHEIRRYRGTEKRDVSREVSIDDELNRSSDRLRALLAADEPSPSQKAILNEQEVLLADILERLPDDYREVIVLRNLQNLSHEEVARRMNRGLGAVRMLWVRALARLRKEIKSQEGGGNN